MELRMLEIVEELFGNEDDDLLTPPGEHDAAIVKTPNSKYLVLTCDTVNAKSDFPPEMTHEEMGMMAASVTLSDIAASGAEPIYFLSSISMRDADEEMLRRILEGIRSVCSRYGVKVAGGDLDFAEYLTIAGFAVGCSERIVSISGAKAGESVYITAPLGKAQLCLEMLEKGYGRDRLPFASSLYTPQPRIEEGVRIAKIAGAMTDVSDSLAVSLNRISRKSGVRIILDLDKLPLEPLLEYADLEKSLELFLYGGGDFELLFTGDERGNEMGIKIGEVTEGEGVYLRRGGRVERIEARGYEHW